MTERRNLTIQNVIATEVSQRFVQGCADRMAVSYYKYGPVIESTSNHIESLKKRLEKYEEDGNTEWLMDVANFAMIEYMVPRHPSAHYRATDSDESPGRVTTAGKTTHESHRETRAGELSGSLARRAREGS